MSTPTFEQRIALWFRAYEVVRDELTDEHTRNALRTMNTRQPIEGESAEDYLREQLVAAKQVATIVQANNRTAATVAAQLVIGLRTPVDQSEWLDDGLVEVDPEGAA